MELVAHFRMLIHAVDPALLTKDDRLALIDLVGRCFQHNDGGGGLRMRSPNSLQLGPTA